MPSPPQAKMAPDTKKKRAKARRWTGAFLLVLALGVTVMWFGSKPIQLEPIAALSIDPSNDGDDRPGWHVRVTNSNKATVVVECRAEVFIDGRWEPQLIAPHDYPRDVPAGASNTLFFVPDPFPNAPLRARLEVLRPRRSRPSFLEHFIITPLARLHYNLTGTLNVPLPLHTYVQIRGELEPE